MNDQTQPTPSTHGTSRRTVLKGAGASIALGTAGWNARNMVGGITPAAAQTTPHSAPGRLAVVFLRGGMDGLSAVVPANESAYYDARPTIAIPDNQVLDLDGQFGMHPSLSRLHGLFNQGRVAVAVGTGNLAGNRSHFVAQDLWEYGTTTGNADGMGWLGRHLSGTGSTTDSLFRALTMGNLVDLSLRGAPALNVLSIEKFGLVPAAATLRSSMANTYQGDRPIEVTGRTALDAIDLVRGLNGSSAPGGPARSFGDAIELLDGGLGVEVVTLNLGGWDTHADMGLSLIHI